MRLVKNLLGQPGLLSNACYALRMGRLKKLEV